MKTLQSHNVAGARIELHESDGKVSLYIAEASGRDAVAPISAVILRSMLDAIEGAKPLVEEVRDAG